VIEGETANDAALIPRTYLRDGNVIWAIDAESRLRIVPAEILQGYAAEVLVRIPDGGRLDLITSDLSAAVDGMQLRRKGAAGARQSGAPPRVKPATGQPEKAEEA
jgi:hypothetical protein